MTDTVTVRSCSLHDAPTLVSLGIRTFRDTFDEMNTPENMMQYINKNFTLQKVKTELQEPGSVFFLAEKETEAVGYARMRASEKPEKLEGNSALEIERLYADKKYIGKRVGSLLMSTCLQYAREHGADVIWLGVWEHNTRAIAFYEKCGFEKFSEHVFMLGQDAQTDHLMKKNIT